MLFDIIIAIIILLAAVQGYRKGFLKQAFVLFGLVFAIFYTKPLAAILSALFVNTKDSEVSLQSHIALTAVSAAIIIVICIIIGELLQRWLVKGIVVAESVNRTLGASLGVIISSVVIFFGLCIFDVFKSPMSHTFSFAGGIYQSHSMQFVAKYNIVPRLIDDFLVSKQGLRLGTLLNTLRKAQAAQELSQTGTLSKQSSSHTLALPRLEAEDQASFEQLMQNNDFASLAQDTAIHEQLQNKEQAKILLDPRVIRLLADDAFMENAKRFPWEKYYSKP